MMLPKIPYESGAERIPIQIFGGLDRRAGAGNGAISDMLNMSGADFPVMATRQKRVEVVSDLSHRLIGMYAARSVTNIGETLFYVRYDDPYEISELYAYFTHEGFSTRLMNLTNEGGYRVFARLGNRLVIWPDKYIYDNQLPIYGGYSGPLTKTVEASCTFTDGTYAGEPAEANTILGPSGFDWSEYFKVGDGVTISGAFDLENNKTAIIREISGNKLRFDENTFVNDSLAQNITIERDAPDMDFIFAHDNRIWGCEGDTIYCSKLGDPFNWNVFDGLSTDSWTVNTGTPGSFTGAISFMGYPMFFKEDRIFKVHGNRPQNFEVISSVAPGVSCDNNNQSGKNRSMAVVGDTLYYHSPSGFVRYNGGYPVVIDAALNRRYTSGAAVSDGKRYYVYTSYENELIVYTPETGLWHKEDNTMPDGEHPRIFANLASIAFAGTPDSIYIITDDQYGHGTMEDDFDSYVTFADFDMQTFAGKYPVRLWLRYESENDLTVEISYNGGAFETVTVLASGGKNTKYSPLPIRRCDRFRIKISTTGAWKLYAMEFEVRAERTNRKGG